MNLCANLSVSEDGHLLFAGQDTLKLASQYGTPLYVVDEDRVRFNCRVYTKAFSEHFRPGSMPLYAGKANAFKSLTQVVASENMGLDVVSPGEIYNAKFAGFDMSKTFFHGNNKTDEDVAFAFDNGVGYFVAERYSPHHPRHRSAYL